MKQVIAALAPKLLRMKRRGITTDGMVVALKENKISIDGKTLNRYLSDYNQSKPLRKKKIVSDTTAKPKAINSSDGKDSFTPKEETPSGQAAPKVATRPDPLKELI